MPYTGTEEVAVEARR